MLTTCNLKKQFSLAIASEFEFAERPGGGLVQRSSRGPARGIRTEFEFETRTRNSEKRGCADVIDIDVGRGITTAHVHAIDHAHSQFGTNNGLAFLVHDSSHRSCWNLATPLRSSPSLRLLRGKSEN